MDDILSQLTYIPLGVRELNALRQSRAELDEQIQKSREIIEQSSELLRRLDALLVVCI